MRSPAENLQLAVAVVASPDNWAKRTMYKIEDGKRMWCSVGAVLRVCADGEASQATVFLDRAWQKRGYADTVRGNDSSSTRHEDVLAAFYEAIRLAKEAEHG